MSSKLVKIWMGISGGKLLQTCLTLNIMIEVKMIIRFFGRRYADDFGREIHVKPSPAMSVKDFIRPVLGYPLKGLGWLTERYISHYLGIAIMNIADLVIGDAHV